MIKASMLVIFPLLCGATVLSIVWLLQGDLTASGYHVRSADPYHTVYSIPLLNMRDTKLSLSTYIGGSPNQGNTAAQAPPDVWLSPHGELYTPENISLLSQSDDIDIRGKWQQGQIERYCRKYGLDDQLYQLPTTPFHVRMNLFRHLIFDDERQLLFCFIPKVGCTTMRRFMFVLQGVIPPETIHWKHVSEDVYLHPGILRASFLNTTLTDDQRVTKIKNYFKFVLVRNPLERLVSAFRNKIEQPLHFSKLDTFEMIRRHIIGKYRREELNRWEESNGTFKMQVNFTEYISWIVESENALLNEHFSPVIDNSHPCRIRYDFYGNFKLYDADMAQIIAKLKCNPEYFRNNSARSPGHRTKDYLERYYTELSRDMKRQLFEDFYQELDFYYHLYPEERSSHVQLLEVEQMVS